MNGDYSPIDLVVLGLVVYRVTRFIGLDTLIERTRERVIDRLESKRRLWREKLAELITCPFCATIWVSAGATAAYHFDLLPDFVWWWLAAATIALIIWAIIDSED